MSDFSINCAECPRLAEHLAGVRAEYPDYHARPVPPFGDPRPRLLIVGLAPGMHGANATGRPFTGDYAGILLYETLHRYGYANLPESVAADDRLRLKGARITNAVKCLPPANKPTTAEIKTCNRYLGDELAALKGRMVILALGRIAHEAVLRALELKPKDHPFGHNTAYQLEGGRWLVSSYHCSRYNTQTRRLTEKMFHSVFNKIDKLLNTSS